MRRRNAWLAGLGLLVLVGCLSWLALEWRPAMGAVETSVSSEPPGERRVAPTPRADSSATTQPPDAVPGSSDRETPTVPERGRAPVPAASGRPAPRVAAPATRTAIPRVRLALEQPPDAPPPPLEDRIGLDPELLRTISDELLPLTDECLEDARERDPGLDGMLAVEVNIVVEPEVGAIVETVEFSELNELDDQELQTCVRETALSMLLPADESGTQELMFTVPVEAER